MVSQLGPLLKTLTGLSAQPSAPTLRHLARTFPSFKRLLLSLRSLTVSFSFQDVFLSSLLSPFATVSQSGGRGLTAYLFEPIALSLVPRM